MHFATVEMQERKQITISQRTDRRMEKGHPMLNLALLFLVIALVAAGLGFGGIAGAAAGIAKILFFVFLVLFVVAIVFGRVRAPRV